MPSEIPIAYRLASMCLYAVPFAMLIGFIGSRGLQNHDDSPAFLLSTGIILLLGLISGLGALWASRQLGPKRLRGKAIAGIVLILAFAGIMALFSAHLM